MHVYNFVAAHSKHIQCSQFIALCTTKGEGGGCCLKFPIVEIVWCLVKTCFKEPYIRSRMTPILQHQLTIQQEIYGWFFWWWISFFAQIRPRMGFFSISGALSQKLLSESRWILYMADSVVKRVTEKIFSPKCTLDFSGAAALAPTVGVKMGILYPKKPILPSNLKLVHQFQKNLVGTLRCSFV